jgi:hypothetical protein
LRAEIHPQVAYALLNQAAALASIPRMRGYSAAASTIRRPPFCDNHAKCIAKRRTIMQGKMLTALIALALAAPAFAQDTTNAAQTNDNKTRSQVDNQSNSTRNNQQSSNDQNVPTKNSSTKPMKAQNNVAGADFDSLDTKHQGYLKPADVASNKKLSTNFKSCDKNKDGRLSREEFEGCSAGM